MKKVAKARASLVAVAAATARDYDLSRELDRIQVSPDGKTVWVNADDGTTVGRFSKVFGMDVHTTHTEQLAGAAQCLRCTHEAPGQGEWNEFCELMKSHYGIAVDRTVMKFD